LPQTILIASGLAWLFALGAAVVATVAQSQPPPAERASDAQYLPWRAGETVHVIQGNDDLPAHAMPSTRYAWDFGLQRGEPVLLGVAGTVAEARGGCAESDSPTCNGGYGNTVSVRAGDGTCARFEHLATLAVTTGLQLRVGAPIGTVGASGDATGYHLHYQREVCATGISLPSAFREAGIPTEGADVTSALPVTTG
jgi:murein DD-endopeptidase MepM/ murein hydrolase activator NlpD